MNHVRALGAIGILLLAAVPARAQTARDSARAAYERGMAELQRGDAHIPSPGNILRGLTFWQDFLSVIGKDHVARARDEFRVAAATDSTFAPPAVELAKLALASRDPDALAEAGRALRPVGRAADATPETRRVAAEVARAMGDLHSAGELARAYAAAPGSDRSLARLVEARADFLVGDDDGGAKLYMAGLDSLTTTGAEAYLSDLGPLAEDARAAGWDSVSLPERSEWLRRYWFRRAAASGRTPAAVVAEHYRRVRFALDHFPRTSRRAITAASGDAIAHDVVSGLDDRGIIYVRHGAPDQVVKTPDGDCTPRESWLYRDRDGSRIYHFVTLNRATEFMLVADPLVGCRGAAAQTRELEALSELDGRYGALAAQAHLMEAGSHGDASVGAGLNLADEVAHGLSDLRTETRKQAMEGLRQSGYAMHARAPLPFYYDTYAFRGDSGRTELVAALAIPGDGLDGHPAADGVSYAASADFAVLDTAALTTQQADTALSFTLPRAFRDDENVRLNLELAVAPGNTYAHRVSVRVSGQDVEGAYGGPLDVPSFRGDTLMTSDLVLAQAHGKGWKRGAVELGLVPPRQYARGPVSLFYELYNLPADSTYQTRIRITSLSGTGLLGHIKRLFTHGTALSISFDDVARPDAQGTVQVLRQLDLRQLSPGPYRIEVETRGAGRTVRRESEFVVLKNG